MQKPVTYIDGYSRNLWASLMVKSVRMGWPEGCRQAEQRIGPSYATTVALTQIFEDIWPAEDEIHDCIALANKRDWEGLCKYATHFDKGLTTPIFKEWPELKPRYNKEGKESNEIAREVLGLKFVPPRMAENLWEWCIMRARVPTGLRRTIDETKWYGMPVDMADMHTPEGKAANRLTTILTGNERGMLWLEREVLTKGWEEVRKRIHAKGPLEPRAEPKQSNKGKQMTLLMLL